MKKNIFLLLALATLVLSCNKNQSAVKKLDGIWNIDKMETSNQGLITDFIALGGSSTMTFNECKLKNDEWCVGHIYTSFMGSTTDQDIVFKVEDKGKKLVQKEHQDSTETISISIDELNKTTFKGTQTEGTSITSFTASKQ